MIEKISGKETSDETREEREEIARGVTGLGFGGDSITVLLVSVTTNTFSISQLLQIP